MPICFLDSSVFIVRRYADTATLPQSQDRTPASASVHAPAFIFFPAGWKCQPEGEDIGSGCCGGGVIQLRSRERALLRQGQLFEPMASSGPAAMVLAISRNLSCIPRRSPCPGRYPLPLASGFLPESMPHPSGVPTFHSPHGTLAHTDILSLHKSKQKKPGAPGFTFIPERQAHISQAGNETRTHDPFITSEVLYRLSYSSLC